MAYADRNLYIADSDFVAVPSQGLMDKAYLKELIYKNSRTPLKRRNRNSAWSEELLRQLHRHKESAGTTHFSVVDSYGNSLSLTSTIETGFGSRLIAGGFLLNNEMTDFAFVPKKMMG